MTQVLVTRCPFSDGAFWKGGRGRHGGEEEMGRICGVELRSLGVFDGEVLDREHRH